MEIGELNNGLLKYSFAKNYRNADLIFAKPSFVENVPPPTNCSRTYKFVAVLETFNLNTALLQLKPFAEYYNV